MFDWAANLKADDTDPEIVRIAQSLADYLHEKNSATDTLDGILRWWLMRQSLQEQQNKVRQALEVLIDRGVISKRTLADGTELFTGGKTASGQIEQDE
jgi:hypothetical protein